MLEQNRLMDSQMESMASCFLKDGLLDQEKLQHAIREARRQRLALGFYLAKNELLSSEKILNCLARHFDLAILDVKDFDPCYLEKTILKPETMCRYRVLPLHHDDETLHLGITNPADHSGISAIKFQTGLNVHCCLISDLDFEGILSTWLRTKRLDHQLESTLVKISSPEEIAVTDPMTTEEEEGPVGDFVNRLIHDALEQHVSDVHIEPFSTHCRIRFRRDGLLQEVTSVPLHLAARIITRLKILAKLNIAERRLPQDGRLQLTDFSHVDIRLNTCPVLYGEKIVLRLLNTMHVSLEIDQLGMTPGQKASLMTALHKPQGLILVTGPTGSGKTITLYTALNYLNQIEKNISSVEDPVEIELNGINQVSVNGRIGLDFSTLLRTFLRQDPDVIMVGEIRDNETARMAVQAAQTGHLVLSTLHTNSAIDTITRLQAMGVPDWQFAEAVSLIIAQRLVRKICEHCKQTTLKGCERCCQGYHGRVGIFELLPMNQSLASLILTHQPLSSIVTQLKKDNIIFLQDAAQEKIRNGLTSLPEIQRVLG